MNGAWAELISSARHRNSATVQSRCEALRPPQPTIDAVAGEAERSTRFHHLSQHAEYARRAADVEAHGAGTAERAVVPALG